MEVASIQIKRLKQVLNFPTCMIFQGNKTVGEATVNKCQKKNRIRKSQFATPNEIMDLGKDHQGC